MSYEDEYTDQYDEQINDEEQENTNEADEPEEEITPSESSSDDKQQQLLTDISDTLQLLTIHLNEYRQLTEKLQQQVEEYNASAQILEQITENMPELIYEKCLDEYKKIINNAAKNYNQLQKSIVSWHKNLEKDHDRMFKWISISSILTPILLLILILLQLF
ncbi:hypothetical protein GXM21_12730 (plasmid) [Megamonas funiformis]|uniref:Uncharacterized protein n=1 Tax=Megamonas funiformis YIT 11815 TaxID=742816 RepID=A0ABN0EF66_9FIRM|nr:hypothetical protein [Megamonas funiformis]EHR31898.1 hypothetical protein HMPREF9454_02461 [Megamonas funiformis YIT 11815]QIB61286.1 hypothetical protein GXM21_12730 [Megamonas funiformis]